MFRAIAFVGLAAVGGAIFLIRVPVLDPVRAEPQPLEFSSCDFGRAWVQPHFVHRITIANHTGEPLTIIAITGSCKCTTVRALADTIPAHDTVPVELVLDLRDAEKDAAFKSSLMARLKKLDGEEVLAETTITGAVDKCPLQIDKPAGEILLSIQGVDDLLTGQVRLRADADYQFTAVPDGRVVGAVPLTPAIPAVKPYSTTRLHPICQKANTPERFEFVPQPRKERVCYLYRSESALCRMSSRHHRPWFGVIVLLVRRRLNFLRFEPVVVR